MIQKLMRKYKKEINEIYLEKNIGNLIKKTNNIFNKMLLNICNEYKLEENLAIQSLLATAKAEFFKTTDKCLIQKNDIPEILKIFCGYLDYFQNNHPGKLNKITDDIFHKNVSLFELANSKNKIENICKNI